MNRLRMAWQLIHHGTFDDGAIPNDIDEARQMRRASDRGLADARAQRPEIEEATQTLRANQRDLDFTELVEDAFSRRRPRPS